MAYRDWGSKTGGGGVASKEHEALARKERLRQLAMDTVDLKNDPYFMRNHLGTYECKLCLTLHANEGNYLAHTQGRRHQSNLKRRAAMESQKEAAKPRAPMAVSIRRIMHKRLKIGTPGYQITKQKDPDTGQLSLLFQVRYPQIADGLQPRHRFMSAFEQKTERPDRRYQYLLFAAEPYETVAFKIPNIPIDKTEGRFYTNWDREGRTFTLQLFFEKPEANGKANGPADEPVRGENIENHRALSRPKDPFAGIDHPM
ncbi:Pre-mRNA-splicing factor SF3a complex subunit 2 (Prp11) [Gracilaria domingensis]|nr:Pre-mRNA-splicing factor SF3a complex subunit 2 (Prp11) [Gracilaria domingensis]